MIASELEPHAAALGHVASLCALAEQKAREGAICIPHRLQDAETMALAAGQDAAEALVLLRGLGVLPSQAARPRPKEGNPLADLARVENSRREALALLDALRHALPLAEALDAKRGDVLAEPVGGSAGLVWGDRLLQAVCGLELELFGPGGAVTGARE